MHITSKEQISQDMTTEIRQLRAKQQSDKLDQAIDLMTRADVLIQQALGACDECEEASNRIDALCGDILGLKMFVDVEAK